jgi:chromate transporter
MSCSCGAEGFTDNRESALPRRQEVSHGELFLGFNKIALSGFGGVMSWARRTVVEERGWLSSEEFTSLFGLCQFMPGPNTLNLAVCVGARFQGATGALVSLCGLLSLPFLIVISFGALYGEFGELPMVQSMLRGIAAVAAGLMLAMGLRMAADLVKRPLLLVFSAIILAGVIWLRWPLPALMLGLAPLSMWLSARRYCRGS